MGKKGGALGGHARAAKMTAEERSDSARKAIQTRWGKAKAQLALQSGVATDGEVAR